MSEVKFYEILWGKGDLIRNIKTGKPYLVVHIYKHTAVMVVDLQEKSTPNTPLIILPRDFTNFTLDTNMKMALPKGAEAEEEWEYDPMTLQ